MLCVCGYEIVFLSAQRKITVQWRYAMNSRLFTWSPEEGLCDAVRREQSKENGARDQADIELHMLIAGVQNQFRASVGSTSAT